jgi:uncharacterized protein (TIGR03437 family)
MKITQYAVLLLAGPVFAQEFRQLATNRDGSVLYFSSPLRMKGTDQYFHPKIFTWDSVNGVRLYEQREADIPFPPPVFGFSGTQFFSLVAPDVSSDAGTVAVTGVRFCNFSDICVFQIEEFQSTIYISGQAPVTASGSASLSRNGRFALLRSSVGGLPAPSKMPLLDLQTGQQTQYQGAWIPPGIRHQVANDGTVVVPGIPGGFSLGQGGQLKPAVLPPSTPALYPPPMINDAGTLVIYQAGGNAFFVPARLSAYSVATGFSTDLVTDSADTPGFAASISDDGSLVAFLYGQNRQAYLIRSDGTGMRQITDFSEPVTDIELSGDGSVSFAVTASNRIVRIDVASAQSTEIVPATPYTNVPAASGFLKAYVGGYRFGGSRGSVVSVPGSGFAADTENAQPPFPLSLDGVELHVNGSPVPIASVAPTSIGYPVPWDLLDAPVDVEVWVSSASASPFIAGFEIEPARLAFYYPPFGALLVAVHEDFSSLLSSVSPAQPGEIIHVYAHDLGPVNPAPPAGLPAPLSPLALLVPPVSCILNADTNPNTVDRVDVLFAGLAPELLNVFQVDVQLPASLPGNPSRLQCYVGDPIQAHLIVGFLPVAVQP